MGVRFFFLKLLPILCKIEITLLPTPSKFSNYYPGSSEPESLIHVIDVSQNILDFFLDLSRLIGVFAHPLFIKLTHQVWSCAK